MPVGVKQFDLVSDWDARQSWDEGCNASGPEGPAAHNQGLATNYPPPSKRGHHLEKPRFFLNNLLLLFSPLISSCTNTHTYTNEDWDDEDWDARNFLKKIWKIGGKWHGRVTFRFRHVNDRTPVSFASLFQLLRATIQITFTVRVISEFKRGACVRRIRILGSINVRGRLWNRSNAVHGLSTGSRLIP